MKLWIARSDDGRLTLHSKEPTWIENYGWTFVNMIISSENFPEVTFENSPQEIKLVLCNSRIDTINIQDCDPKKQPCLLTNHGIKTNVLFK